MDLLTRGAGFGYIGSTPTSLIYASFPFVFFSLEAAVMAHAPGLAPPTPPPPPSLIYASFTFVFFALEAAVMAYALELALGIPPHWGYLICALVVIPLVTHGVSTISRLQMWTQPLWLLMLVLPFGYVLTRDPGAFVGMLHYGGESGRGAGFDLHLFGAALTVGIALITQMGEQADYLRFMPAATPGRRGRWWLGVLAGGPGWVLPGVLKM